MGKHREPEPMSNAPEFETLTHRLILPRDANHHGTLYAGALLALVLEAGYATAYRAVGRSANLVLKRVLDLRCIEPVSIGSVVEIRGREVYRARAQVVVGLRGTPLPDRRKPWMDSLMQFVQVDDQGHPEPLSAEPDEGPRNLDPAWSALHDRARRLLAIRV
jgi:acyl-CoA thioesterase YciA